MLRDYQEIPVRKAIDFFHGEKGEPSLMVLPTAWGKSWLIAYVALSISDDDHLLVLALTKIHHIGYRDLESVKDMLKTEVLNDKKFEQIKTKYANVKSLADAQKAGAKVDSVNQITFGAPVFVQATGASEPALSGAVAGVKQGEFSPALVKGNAGAYLFQVNRKAAREGEKFDAKAVEMRLQQQAAQAASRFVSELYQKANVVDNRYLFF